MRILKTSMVTVGLLATACSMNAQAQFFDSLKQKAGDMVQQAGQAQLATGQVTAEQPASQPKKAAASSAGRPSLGSGPSDKLVSFTKCAGLSLTNIMVGELGDYTFQQGFSQEKRSGFINRKPGKLAKTCILPSIYSHQAIYMEVDTKAYEAIGDSNSWEMQCVKSANPSAGAVGNSEPKGEYPYKVSWLSGKDMMLHCGHSESHVSSCAEGSNSSRSGKYKKLLKEKGKTMLTVYGTASTLAPANGEKLYCQYYNKPSGKSLFAFEYLRTRS